MIRILDRRTIKHLPIISLLKKCMLSLIWAKETRNLIRHIRERVRSPRTLFSLSTYVWRRLQTLDRNEATTQMQRGEGKQKFVDRFHASININDTTSVKKYNRSF